MNHLVIIFVKFDILLCYYWYVTFYYDLLLFFIKLHICLLVIKFLFTVKRYFFFKVYRWLKINWEFFERRNRINWKTFCSFFKLNFNEWKEVNDWHESTTALAETHLCSRFSFQRLVFSIRGCITLAHSTLIYTHLQKTFHFINVPLNASFNTLHFSFFSFTLFFLEFWHCEIKYHNLYFQMLCKNCQHKNEMSISKVKLLNSHVFKGLFLKP